MIKDFRLNFRNTYKGILNNKKYTRDIGLVLKKMYAKNMKGKDYGQDKDALDYLRKNTIYDLVNYTKENNKELWLVGTNKSDYLDDLLTNENVKYYESTWDVERYVKECEETASILMGRTTIEGWLCGKSGWVYQIDDQGNILNKELKTVPSDVHKYKSENIVSEIIEEYNSVI